MEITRIGNPGDIPQISIGSSDLTSNGRIASAGQKESDTVRVPQGELEAAVKKMNEVFDALTTHLKFNYHEGTGHYYVSIVNENTHEVVREIPPKKFLDMVAYMEKHMKGIFVDEVK